MAPKFVMLGAGAGLRTNERLSALASFTPETTRLVSVNSTYRVPPGSGPFALRGNRPVTFPRSDAVTRPTPLDPRTAPAPFRNVAVKAAQSSCAPSPPNQPDST